MVRILCWSIAFLTGGVLGLVVKPEREVQAAATGVEVPAGFAIQTVVQGLTLPTDMVFTPDGDILVTEKGVGVGPAGRSKVRLIRNGQLMATPVLELSTSVPLDSGLLAIVLDPDFATNHYFYVWYATGERAKGWAGKPHNRLSRFTFDPVAGTAPLETEEIILDGVPWAELHAGGGLLFDDLGNLLITMGDAYVFDAPNGDDSPVFNEPPADNLAQDLSSLAGKVLRIRPERTGYSVPPDNPFLGVADVAPEIFAYGLRNPFRITKRAADGQFFLTDVGFVSWEEVNWLQPRVNYGWPIREGPCPFGRRETNCKGAGKRYTDPVAAYIHQPGIGASITAFGFYEEEQFPAVYQGKLFLADFNLRTLSTVDLSGEEAIFAPFGTQVGALVDMEVKREGIYLLNIGQGLLQLLYYTGSDNQAPSAQLAATPVDGEPPLRVTFSAVGSYDLDDIGLQYEWEFGDGHAVTTTTLSVTHEYRHEGVYTAKLTVMDVRGARSVPAQVEVTVYAGERPTLDLIVLGDNERSLYRGGDTILYRATRLAGADGLDAEQPYTWDIELLHNQHAHPMLVGYVGEIGSLEIPTTNHSYESTIRYLFRLTMRTATGIEIRAERELEPDLVEVQFGSSPGAAQIVVSRVEQAEDALFQAIVGQVYEIEAAPLVLRAGMVHEFDHWSILPRSLAAPAALPEIVHERKYALRAPVESVVVTAHYTPTRAAALQFLALIGAEP